MRAGRVAQVALATGAGLLALLGSAFGQVAPTTMPVSEVRPGMRGYGLTVLHGEVPERFNIEVIDVLHGMRPNMDAIIIRTDHPQLQNTASVAGMSGSPIYIEDRLVGAYAYGWQFGKDPIAGVTPIASMFAEAARAIPREIPGVLPPPSRPATPARTSAWRGRSVSESFAAFEQFRQAHVAHDATYTTDMRPATTPLLVGGVGPAAIAIMNEAFAPFGLMAMQGSNGGASPAANTQARFVNGGAIAVTLTRGDITSNAIGTVTHVEGRRVLAFGHPMLNAGELDLPTATARVVHVVASTQRSFKMAEAITPLGSLVQDRPTTIVIDTERAPRMIPLHVRIEGAPNAPKTEWNVEVVNHRLITPTIMASTLAGIIETAMGDTTDMTVDISTDARIVNHPSVHIEDHLVSRGGISDGRALARIRVFSLLEAIYGNPFEQAEPERIDITLRIRFGDLGARIADASVASDELEVGQDARVNVTLRRYGRPDQVRTITVPIPESCAGSEVEIALLPGDDVGLEDPIPRSLNDILAAYGTDLPATSLIAQVRLPTRGLRFEGHIAEHLPASAVDALLANNASTPAATFTPYARTRFDIGDALSGSARVRVRVKDFRR